jgi:hypothetical protein
MTGALAILSFGLCSGRFGDPLAIGRDAALDQC